MVKNTSSENPNTDDASARDGPTEKPKRGLRRRVTAAKSAATHVNAGAEIVLDTVPDADGSAPPRSARRHEEGRRRARGRSIHGSAEAAPPPHGRRAGAARSPRCCSRRPTCRRRRPRRWRGRPQNPRGGGAQASDDDAAGTTRRRTRRRSGDAPREGEDAPNTTVRVRQPRQQQEPELITEPQRVKGSTRLEAKKQRRRDGRDAGRRRPVVTEAEFLARRESVDRVMVVRSKYGRIQIGVLEDGVLVEHYVARAADASLIGNVYLGRVQNVLPSMEAAFVDIGRGRNAVLYSGEVDWEAAAAAADSDGSDGKNQARRIELALQARRPVLVQVTKDPVGHKGARLTSQVSLPGRYLVYVPNGSMNGISRKLPDTERARLKKILKEVLPG